MGGWLLLGTLAGTHTHQKKTLEKGVLFSVIFDVKGCNLEISSDVYGKIFARCSSFDLLYTYCACSVAAFSQVICLDRD